MSEVNKIDWISAWVDALADICGELMHAATSAQLIRWDPLTGTSAIAGGLVSGLFACFIFYLGMRLENRKSVRAEIVRSANQAMACLYILNYQLDSAAKVIRHVNVSLGNYSGADLFAYVPPMMRTLPPSEILKIADLAFLMFHKDKDLITRILELQRWVQHIVTIETSYSERRQDWETWYTRNSFKNVGSLGQVRVELSGAASQEANSRKGILNGLLREISEQGKKLDEMEGRLIEFVSVCRDLYGKYFVGVFPVKQSI